MRQFVTVYNQSGQLLGLLENADGIGYDLKHNDLWTASFRLPSDDPRNALCAAHNLVRLPDEERDVGLYRIVGSPSSTHGGSQDWTEYSLEHVMATLLDDVLFGYHEVGGEGVTTAEVMQYILDRQTVTRWQLGACDFDDEYQYSFENVSLLSALLSLGETIDGEYTFVFDVSTTPWTVSLKAADASPGCGIHYGRNLVEIEKAMDASALVTRLYPLGYGEGVNQLTVREVNNGAAYIDADTASTWGVKASVWTDTRITDPALLLARARQILEGYKNPYMTYTARAIDLSRLTGYSWDHFLPGKLVRVMDSEHGLDLRARIVEVIKSDVMGDPGAVEIVISNAPRDVADSINALADRVGIGELYSQGATNLVAQSFQDNADPQHPATMRVYVPAGVVRINKMLLSWSCSAFRAYETGAASGGGYEETTEGGGASTETTDSTETVVYTSETGGACTATSEAIEMGTGTIGQTGLQVDLPGGDHYHMLEVVRIPALTVDVPDHGHNVRIPGHSHDIDLPDHTHGVILADHTHDIVYGIYEGTTARSVTIKVDGATVPSSAITGRELDVVPYLTKDADGKITRGTWHTVQVVPDRLSRIEADLFTQCFIQSQGGGDY